MMDDVPGSAPAEAPATTEALAGLFEAQITAEREPQKETKSEPPEQPETDAELVETDEEQTNEVTAEEADEQTEDADHESEPEEAHASQIQAPSGLSEADKAEFAKLPTAMQSWVAKRIGEQTADYTRKTQEVAARRNAVDQMATQVIDRMRQYDEILANFTDPDIAPPDPALRNSDPLAYDEQLANYLQRRDLKERAAVERGRLKEELRQAGKLQQQQFWAREAEAMKELAPELAAGTPGSAEKLKSIADYARKLGYTNEMLEGAAAKDVVTLHKAMMYDAQQAAKKAVKVLPKPAPKIIKPGAASAVGRPSNFVRAVNELKAKPTVDSLTAAYLAEMQAERKR